jgi:hypothetical protein
MTFTVSEENWSLFKEAFVEVHKVPIDPDTHEPTMTETQWVKEYGRLIYVAIIRQGLKRVRDKEYPVTNTPEIVVEK